MWIDHEGWLADHVADLGSHGSSEEWSGAYILWGVCALWIGIREFPFE